MLRYLIAGLTLLAGGAGWMVADAKWFGGVTPEAVGGGQTFVSASLSTNTFIAESTNANRVIGIFSITLSAGPPFSGVCLGPLGGADGALFVVNSACQISVGSTAVTTARAYTVTVTGQQTSPPVSPSPFTSASITITGTAPASITLVSVSPSSSSFTGGTGSANSLVANMTATMSPVSPFTGTWSLSGTDAGKFKINPTSGALTVCGPTQTPCTDVAAGPYSVDVIATQADAVGSPKTQTVTITGAAAGAAIATETFTNQGPAMVAGDPVILGQAFRRGDVPAGNCVRPRNATTHANLIYQLDEISTRVQNSDDGSLRHMVYSVQYDTPVATGATGKIEWVLTGAACPTGTQKQALAAFTATHDLKIDFTDVRNQAGSVRDTGHMVFSVNTAASNTGRDAPRKCATGAVRDCWIVMGQPVYVGSGNKDPLLYVMCYLDLTTSPTDQTSLGKVRHVCRVDNPWVKVAAGSVGISGSPGPVGFANDPQGIYYRAEVFNGATSIHNWSRLDRSVSAASNPINTTTGEWNIPNISMGNANSQSWFQSAPFCVTSSGTLPGNFVGQTPCGAGGAGRIFFVDPSYPAANNNLATFMATPYPQVARYVPGSPTIDDFGPPTDQGTGTHSFSYRTYHPKFQSWWTLGPDGQDNWLVGGSHQVRPIYPAWTSAERLYWQQSGVLPPISTSQPVGPDPTNDGQWVMSVYNPISNGLVIGGSGTGPRVDIGIVNEYDSRTIILGGIADWDLTRQYAYSAYPYRFILNEATGRVPVYNNGPPIGPGGNGIGGDYTSIGMGIPLPHAFYQCSSGGRNAEFAATLQNTPMNWLVYTGANFGSSCAWANDHLPNFVDLQYAAFGSRHLLDTIYFDGARTLSQHFPDFNSDGLRDNTINGNHYWAVMYTSVEWRFGYWGYREMIKCSMFGANANPETTVCNDYMKENANYYAVWQSWKQGVGSTSIQDGPFMPGSVNDFEGSGFMYFYGATVNYMGCANLRDPLSCNVMATHAPRYVIMVGGDPPGGMCSFYQNGSSYQVQTSLKFPGHALRGFNVGSYYDTTTAAYHNTGAFTLTMNGGADIELVSSTFEPLLNNGDKYLHIYWDQVLSSLESNVSFLGPDELATQGVLYTISNVTRTADVAQIDGVKTTFRLICPVGTTAGGNCPTPGAPFTGYSFHGAPFNASTNVLGHIAFLTCPPIVTNQYDGGEGGYAIYTASIASLAKILGHGSVSYLGRTLDDALNMYFNVRGITNASDQTNLTMDRNIVVP